MAKKKPAKSHRRAITAADLLCFQWLSDPQISPDGKHILFVRKTVGAKNNYRRAIWIVATSDPNPRQLTAGDTDSQPRWSHDGKRIAFIRDREKDQPQIWVMPADGGEASALTSLKEGSIGAFAWSPDGTSIGFTYRQLGDERTRAARVEREGKGLSLPPLVIDDLWYRLDGDGYFGADRYQLFVADTTTGEHRTIFTRDTTGQMSFDFSPDSQKLVVSANTDRRALIHPWLSQLFIVDVHSGKASKVPGLPIGSKVSVRWSPDGKHIAYASRASKTDTYDTANLELWLCDPVKGGARSLTDREDFCLLGSTISDSADVDMMPKVVWGRDSRHVFMRLGWHGETHIASVAIDGSKIKLHTSGLNSFDLGSISHDGRTLGLIQATPTTLGEVQVGSLSGDKLSVRPLTALNQPLLDELNLSQPHEHWVDSTDGARVQMWSLLPPGFKSGRTQLPAVLAVHGGPHAQYGVGFFHELQLLAANGYAVFFSNQRGSKGYGADHCAAIRGNWGTADWDDVQAVTAYIQQQKFVDAARVGIMGGSYGGYMTNWAIGHTDTFRAAITDRCVSNLVSMVGSSDVIEEPGGYFPGNAWDRPEGLWRQSPLAYFGNVKTPTLIIHSEGDLRCNIEQAEQIFSVLKLRDIPTRFVRYPSTASHGMSRVGPPDLRLHRLGQILEWWRRWLVG